MGGYYGYSSGFDSYLSDPIGSLQGAVAASAFLGVLLIVGVIVMLAAFYVVTAFKWQFIGRKSGLDKDWMPFVPFARTIYKLSIVEEQWWKMFFLDGWWLYSFLITFLINVLSNYRMVTLASVLSIIYLICCLAYNIYWRYKFYVAHNIRPHLSMTILVPGLGTIRTVWDYMIAFGRNYPFTGEGTTRAVLDVVNVEPRRDEMGDRVALTGGLNPADRGAPWNNQPQPGGRPASAPATPAASISGLSGMYAGQTIPMAAGEEMVIGRDSAYCNLIVDQNAEKVSRKHCGVIFDPVRGVYQVTDYSTNGTLIEGGTRLVANMPTTLQRGTVIVLGSRENRFKLN